MKITKTYSIEENLFKRFDNICKTKNINKSSEIQDFIQSFVNDNLEINDEIPYKKIGDESNEYVNIKVINSKEFNKVIISLDDGSLLDIDTFEERYEKMEEDVLFVLKKIKPESEGETLLETFEKSNGKTIIEKDILIDTDEDDIVDPSILNISTNINSKIIKDMFDKIDIDKIEFDEDKDKIEHKDEPEEIQKGPIAE